MGILTPVLAATSRGSGGGGNSVAAAAEQPGPGGGGGGRANFVWPFPSECGTRHAIWCQITSHSVWHHSSAIFAGRHQSGPTARLVIRPGDDSSLIARTDGDPFALPVRMSHDIGGMYRYREYVSAARSALLRLSLVVCRYCQAAAVGGGLVQWRRLRPP